MRRPLRSRVWFDKPYFGYLKTKEGFYHPKGWWIPWSKGGDEFDWHTFVLGNPVTGQIVFAYAKCNGTGDCAEWAAENERAEWPIDAYGHNHVGLCENEECYCKDEPL